MRLTRLLLTMAFVESFATICVERGIYFLTETRLGFTPAQNLGMALGFGLAYVGGSLSSHGLARRLGERRALALAVGGQLLVHGLLGWATGWPAGIVAGNWVLGVLYGLKWPVIESYIGAGQSVTNTARAVGRFNVAWASAVPLAVAAAGPMIAAWPPLLFWLPAGLNLAALALIRPLPARPVHLAADHPDRPPADRLARYRLLLRAGQWGLLAAYSLMWVLGALLPDILAGLGHRVEAATALACLLDAMRLTAFVALGIWVGWHGRAGMLWAALALMPLGYLAVQTGASTGWVVAGELVFGLSAGLVYYAALYYAMIVKNASVDAGGRHESLIGLGFAAGPAVALAGGLAGPLVGGRATGMLLGVIALFALCALQSLRALLALRKLPR